MVMFPLRRHNYLAQKDSFHKLKLGQRSVMTDSKIPPPNPENLIKWVLGEYLPRRQNSKGANL
jgi:hypothetical protein